MSEWTTHWATIHGNLIVLLVSLSNVEVQTLNDTHGIKNLDNITTLKKEDFNTVLGNVNDSFIKRRQLFQISIYLCKYRRIIATTSIRNILAFAHSLAPSDRVGRTASKSVGTSPIKLSPNDVQEFSGVST